MQCKIAVSYVRPGLGSAGIRVKQESKPIVSTRRAVVLGHSATMKRAVELAALAAPRRDPVLIYGETGTGKGLLAEYIHEVSGRKGAFVSVNCATFNPNLIESHLFGYVKGAFTGAEKDTPGLFETAQDGTLFLDEIAETPLEVQPRLLRALEEGLVRRVGGRSEIPVNVRLIAATHSDLRARIAQGRFREDLFYRINAFIITLPPLRDRLEDLPELVEHFLQSLRGPDESARSVSTQCLEALRLYSWPGNLRELRSALAFALAARALSDGPIEAADLPDSVLATKPPSAASISPSVDGVEAEQLFKELYAKDIENPRAWARFLIAFQKKLGNARFGRNDMLQLLRAARGPQPTDSSLINEWQRRIKPAGVSLGLLIESNKKVQINLDACQALLNTAAAREDESLRPTTVVTSSRRVPSNRLQRTNLPPPRTSFVGRKAEMEEVLRLLKDAPALVTLTGPGGSGKTRLAQEIGWELIDRLQGGVWFADLTEARNVEGVAYAVASSLRVPLTTNEPPESAVAGILRARGDCLLILDNFEQVAEAAHQTAGLWAKRAPHLRILVTSRAVLGLEGERVREIRPLTVPGREAARTLSKQAAERFDAVKLFIERAELTNLSFELDEKNAPAVAEICAVLEGLPLSIELAAARVSIMKPEQMIGRLDQKFELLRSSRRDLNDRQRSLFATIDWSYQLLSEQEKDVFEQLGVFKGGFFLGAAEAVVQSRQTGGAGIMDIIQSLRDKSLLHSFDTQSETRFAMYDAIAEFAYAKRQGWPDGEREVALRMRHATHYSTYAEKWDRTLFTGQVVEAVERLAFEQENIFSAQDFLVSRVREVRGDKRAELRNMLARITLGMAHVMRVRGPAGERVPRLARAVDALGGEDSEDLARLLVALSMAHSDRGEMGPAEERAGQSLEMSRRVGSARTESMALMQQGWLLSTRGDLLRSQDLHEQALPILRSAGDKRNEARTLGRLGYLLVRNGRPEDGVKALDEAARMFEEQGDFLGLGYLLINRANVQIRLKRYEDAGATLDRAEKHFHDLGDKRSIGLCQGNRSLLLKLRRDYEGALRCSDLSQKIAREVNDRGLVSVEQANRGHILVDLERYAEAKACFEEALAIHRELKNLTMAAVDIENLAWMAAREGRLGDALNSYDEALDLAKSDSIIVAGIKVSRGESLINAGRAAEAELDLSQALTAFEQSGNEDRDLFKALVAAARCAIALNRVSLAKEIAQRAREVGRKLGYGANDPAKRVKANLAEIDAILNS